MGMVLLFPVKLKCDMCHVPPSRAFQISDIAPMATKRYVAADDYFGSFRSLGDTDVYSK